MRCAGERGAQSSREPFLRFPCCLTRNEEKRPAVRRCLIHKQCPYFKVPHAAARHSARRRRASRFRAVFVTAAQRISFHRFSNKGNLSRGAIKNFDRVYDTSHTVINVNNVQIALTEPCGRKLKDVRPVPVRHLAEDVQQLRRVPRLCWTTHQR
ncbi:hypothetical protein EVAR_70994_1 [Eumeta japonica]|uniref:Uncharacterized protein n=1 Tax=Eumeta variegata TaxID=151549 RepID=A0A4C2A6Q7_EUMVA|nr:hypothetical protein EVAR_70994_1 [Eumeta japonica]